jgi:aconitate hydratase
LTESDDIIINTDMLVAPLPEELADDVELEKGPNIDTLPDFDEMPDRISAPIALKMGDDISTDEILRAGAEVLPFRSNIAKISQFAFDVVDPEYYARALYLRDEDAESDGHSVIGGENYGQGSSREHAAIAPRYLGLRFAIAKSYARIHWQNLANFGVIPLEFRSHEDYDALDQGDTLEIENVRDQLDDGHEVEVKNRTKDTTFTARHRLSDRQVRMILAGGSIKLMKQKLTE